MSLTAIVTNHDYAHFLPQCIESALTYCDEVLVYDDGSTDDSLSVLARYPVTVTHRETASGTPVWGSNKGIKDATSTHLIFLDADNYLEGPPPTTDADYTFAALRLQDEKRPAKRIFWTYPSWPLTADECWQQFVDRMPGQHLMPFPWGGVWRTEFVKPLRWRPFETTGFAADYRTALDWCKHRPTLAYSEAHFLVFRKHDAQWSASPERVLMERETEGIAKTEGMPTPKGGP